MQTLLSHFQQQYCQQRPEEQGLHGPVCHTVRLRELKKLCRVLHIPASARLAESGQTCILLPPEVIFLRVPDHIPAFGTGCHIAIRVRYGHMHDIAARIFRKPGCLIPSARYLCHGHSLPCLIRKQDFRLRRTRFLSFRCQVCQYTIRQMDLALALHRREHIGNQSREKALGFRPADERCTPGTPDITEPADHLTRTILPGRQDRIIAIADQGYCSHGIFRGTEVAR